MRTTIDVDEDLMKTVLQFTKAKTRPKAVAMALEAYAKHEGIRRFMARAGSMPDFMKDVDYKAERALDNRRFEKLFGHPH